MALDPELVERALAEATKRAENLDYFFDRLTSAEWIEPLAARGFFSEPPPQLVEDGYVKAPGWSASRYLARVAVDAPQAVLDVIRGIDSNNERVHDDFEEAALAMPSAQAREIALLDAEWIATREHLYYLLPAKTVSLIARLAEIGEVDVALTLLRVLFEPLPDRRESELVLRHAQSRFTDWEYDSRLRDAVDALVRLAPAELLVALGDLLECAVALLADDEETAPPDRLWRTRVASDEHRAIDVEDALVSALRDAAVSIRQEKLLSDDELARLIGRRDLDIFRRILMHAFAQEPAPSPELVLRYVMDVDEFADAEPSVEYRDLLRREAPRLGTDDLQTLLEVVEQGPDVERYRELAEKYGGRTPSDTDVGAHVARWQLGRLALLQEALPQEWAERRAALIEDFGDHDIGVSGEVHSFVGPTSPVSDDQFDQMSDDELVAYLEEWTPPAEWDSPSVEGLARAFSVFAERNPSRASSLINRLRSARPAYVQWAFHGIEQAARRGENVSWPEVLDLMEWIVGQPRELPGGRGDDYEDLDPGWVWTRRAIASLLEAGLNAQELARIQFAERERVWRIISAISADPDPTPADEERYGGGNMDPATLALNTVRPRALRAAIAYAVWTFYEMNATPESREAAQGSFFDVASEVGELLERHLDPGLDPSQAVRGAIGQHYSNLFALDRGWASRAATLLFPHEDSALREAGWGSFVVYNGPYNNLLEALRGVYLRSAEFAGSEGHGFRWMNGDPREKLGEHIATFYWRGVIDLVDDLFTTYWAAATSEAKAHFVEFVGRSAREIATVEPDILERLKTFWEYVRRSDDGDAATSGAFAWWFAASSLPPDWRLEQLDALLGAGVRPQPGFLVIDALPEMAVEHPLRVVRLTRRLLELELAREAWAVDAWRAKIERVLVASLESGDAEARRVAGELVNWLGARGYREFGQLIA